MVSVSDVACHLLYVEPIVRPDSYQVLLIIDVHTLLVREVRQGPCSINKLRQSVHGEKSSRRSQRSCSVMAAQPLSQGCECECLFDCGKSHGSGIEHGVNEALRYRGVPLSGTVSRIGRGSWSQPLSFVGRVLTCRLT